MSTSRPSDRATRGATKTVVTVFAVGVLCAVSLISSQVANTAAARDFNRGEDVSSRVRALMRLMTLDEKVGQMDQQEVTQITDTSNACISQGGFNAPNLVCMQKILIDNHTGSILAGGTDIPPGNTGLDWANAYNTIQQFVIKNSRLHIPLLFGVDAVHGFGHPFQAPLFPQSIGMGATWDPAAAKAGGAVTANALRATGWVWDFAPVQDLSRDNRWGRTYETWAEEPALSAALGGANVQGLQSPGPAKSLNVTATVKHFAGYSQSVNGHDRNEALLPINYLQDVMLPSYKGALDAGAGTVMVDSGSINGVPATASRYLLTEVLRDQLGFEGVVISDYGDVPALNTAYHIAADLPDAIAKAVNAGVDVSMEPFHAEQWQAAIVQDVQTGKISQRRIDEAVRRILTLKFKLGLFDQPCVQDPNQPCVDPQAANAAVTAGRDTTGAAARESVTLLRNEGKALPLSPSSKIVLTGPSADSMTNQLGGWSVSWQGVAGAGHVCCMGPPDQIPPGTTVLGGLQGADTNVVYAPDQAAAMKAAGAADAVVVAVGEKAYAEGLGDNPQPQLPPEQQASHRRGHRRSAGRARPR
jgi:beta-glucosidase